MFGPDLLAAPVVAPGVKERRVYLPRGRWIDWWRSVRYRRADGSFHAREATLLRGGAERTPARAARGAPAPGSRRQRAAAASR